MAEMSLEEIKNMLDTLQEQMEKIFPLVTGTADRRVRPYWELNEEVDDLRDLLNGNEKKGVDGIRPAMKTIAAGVNMLMEKDKRQTAMMQGIIIGLTANGLLTAGGLIANILGVFR